MANYTTAALATAQAKLMGDFQKGEMRYRDPVTFKEYIRSSPVMMPSYEEIKKAANRAVTAFYLERQSRSLGTGISHNYTGTKGTAGSLTPSWTIYNDVFKWSLKQANNNVYQFQTMVQNEVEQAMRNFAEGLETKAVDHAFSNRTQVNTANADGSFNDTQYVYEIFTEKEKRAIQIAQSMMDENKFAGPFVVLCDHTAFNKFQYYAAQGSGNDENLSFQFNGVRFVRSNGLYDKFAGLDTPYTDGGFIIVPEGMLAVLPWIEPQYREGQQTQVNRYSTLINPIDGLTYGVHEYDEKSDESSSGGYYQDAKTEVQVHNHIAFEHAPLSSGSPLFAGAFKKQTS